jgi:hypothetical protein
MGKTRNKHKMLIGKYQGKAQLGRFSLKWEDNIKMGEFCESVN